MIRKWRRLLAIGVGLISTVGAINVLAGPIGTGGGPTAEQIIGSGSDTTIIMMENIDGLYLASEGCFKFFGTTKPTAEELEDSDELFDQIERGQGIYVIVYENDEPSQIFFAGYSYD